MTNLKSTLAVLALGATLASCGGGGGGGSTGPSKSWQSSSYITADGFVSALNDVDGAYYDTSYVVKDQYDTERGYGDWFVIYDAKYDRNLAVDIDYVRTLEYYDYYASNYNTGEAFRDQQWNDIYDTGLLGDGYGDDYEEVVYAGSDYFEDYYIGLDSGSLYEDEAETYDVSQMAADIEKKSLLAKAADVSVAYEIDMVSSMELVSIAVKAQKMLSRAEDEHLLEEDAMALKNDIEKFTGATFDDFQKAQEDREFREKLLKKVSEKRKVSAENLENKLLPELFNIQL